MGRCSVLYSLRHLVLMQPRFGVLRPGKHNRDVAPVAIASPPTGVAARPQERLRDCSRRHVVRDAPDDHRALLVVSYSPRPAVSGDCRPLVPRSNAAAGRSRRGVGGFNLRSGCRFTCPALVPVVAASSRPGTYHTNFSSAGVSALSAFPGASSCALSIINLIHDLVGCPFGRRPGWTALIYLSSPIYSIERGEEK